LGFEEQVVEDETEIGLARAMVDQAHVGMVVQHFLQQRFDELVEVIDLLELAAAVLVQLAVAREDVQFLEQFDGLAGADLMRLRGARQWVWPVRLAAGALLACLLMCTALARPARRPAGWIRGQGGELRLGKGLPWPGIYPIPMSTS
jgi:hypothetical protein